MSASRSRQRIRDPLHNLVEFGDDEFEHTMWQVISTEPFQRLRRIKQLGFSDLVYPGATHSRFAHSVGVFHTARNLAQVIKRELGASSIKESRINIALAAALVHDLGHGPFSHAFEEVGNEMGFEFAKHEKVSDQLIRSSEVSEALKLLGSGFHDDVAKLIMAEAPSDVYGAIVSSQFDADRLDYMQRDRLMSGTRHGAIDFKWLLANIEIGEVSYGEDETKVGDVDTFVLGSKAIHAAESYVLGLFQLYPTVYFHKTTRGAEKIFTALIKRVFKLSLDGKFADTGLPINHPLVTFPNASSSIDSVLKLDDTVIWGALPLLEEAKDKNIKELASRLRKRKLYKSINVRERIKADMGADSDIASSADELDRRCEAVRRNLLESDLNDPNGTPRLLWDQAKRSPYKRLQQSKGPLNQIRIKNLDGSLIDLQERSSVVAGIEEFKLSRAYFPEDDQQAEALVRSSIEQARGC